MPQTTTLTRIGPQDHGTRMSLEEFARVEGEPGYIYELEKGVIVVVDIPGLRHIAVWQKIRNALVAYQLAHPSRVYLIAGSSESALRLPEMESERHADLAVYLTAMPEDDPQPWEYWIPEIAVEVVSPSSKDRDYRIKRDEYLKAGVRLYWIIDPQIQSATILTRHGDTWREKRLDATGRLTTSLLPGFDLALVEVFGAPA